MNDTKKLGPLAKFFEGMDVRQIALLLVMTLGGLGYGTRMQGEAVTQATEQATEEVVEIFSEGTDSLGVVIDSLRLRVTSLETTVKVLKGGEPTSKRKIIRRVKRTKPKGGPLSWFNPFD